MESLWAAGASVRAYDPEAAEETKRIYGERSDLSFFGNEYEALDGADALVVCTEWSAFRSPDWERVSELMNANLVFDGRNLYEPDVMSEKGYVHYAIGRRQKA